MAKVRTRGVVFLAWGTPAGKRVTKVSRTTHKVLMSVHPSPLSAMRGFLTCGCFKEANAWLRERYGAGGEIEWGLGGVDVLKKDEDGGEQQSKEQKLTEDSAVGNDVLKEEVEVIDAVDEDEDVDAEEMIHAAEALEAEARAKAAEEVDAGEVAKAAATLHADVSKNETVPETV